MDGPERAAAAQAAAAAVSEVNSTVEAVSRIIRRRVRRGLSVLGPAGDASMAAVDATHDCAHRAIRGATAAVGSVGAELLEATTPEDAPSLVGDAERAHLVAGLGAAFGDGLPEALAPPMRWRTERGEAAMNRVAVFIHGLGGHDRQWSTDYLDTMRSAGITPVVVQYTTGRPVAINGLQFDELLDQLVQEWPVEIDQLIIVAHSMGGLVTANAFEHASDGSRWPGRVTDVVTLGTPHKGAPLERLSDRALNLIAVLETAAPIATLGHRRSQGIKDLAHGAAAPLPARVHHHAVVAHLGSNQMSPASLLIGDGMVRRDSAAGHTPTSDSVTVVDIAGVGHLTLLDHAQVTALLRRISEALP